MVTWGPTQNLGPIGSAVLTFIGYKQTNKHPNKKTDRQAKFILRCDLHVIELFLGYLKTSLLGSFAPYFLQY